MPEPRTVLLTAWSHSDPVTSRAKATAFINAVRTAMQNPKPGIRYPFAGPFELALINSGIGRWPAAGEIWMVATLVPMQDNGNMILPLRPWLNQLGVDWGAVEYETEEVPAEGTLTDFAKERAWGDVVDTFQCEAPAAS